MTGFWQAYGSWIIFGLFFLLMMRMHGSHGGGCGMGGHDHSSPQPDEEGPVQVKGVESEPKQGAGCH